MLTSRQRVIAALNHTETDRVPIDFSGHRSSGIMVQAYKKLRAALGLPPSALYVYDFIQQLAIPEDDVLDRFGVDVIDVGHPYVGRAEYWKDWELQDGTPCKIPAFIEVERDGGAWVVRGDEGQAITIQKPGCLYFEQCCYPLHGSDEAEFNDLGRALNQVMWFRLGSPPAPIGLDAAGVTVRRREAQQLRDATDRAIYAPFGGNLLETGQMLFRNDGFLAELAGDPTRMHRFLDRLLETHLANLDKFLDAVGPYVDVIGFGDDLGMQAVPQISPRMYREFFKLRHGAMWARVKQRYPHLKVGLHCCGGVYPLLADLIDAGLDAINPVQISCANMEPARLKAEFGRDLTFWGGGCDTRSVLPHGSPDEVAAHVAKNLEVWKPGGGFVFQQVHNIMADVPPANIIAMFDTVLGN